MLVIKIKITSPSTKDMELALKEVLRLFSEGYTSGADKDGYGTRYDFTVTGEEEEVEDEE